MGIDTTKFFKNIEYSNLKNSDFEIAGRYLFFYANCIEPMINAFDWNNQDFVDFCKANGIQPKGNKRKLEQRNHFWFNTQGFDTAYSFLKHIRNSFAHGLVEVKYEGRQHHKYFIMKDFSKDKVQTMSACIRSDLLWSMIRLIYESKKW